MKNFKDFLNDDNDKVFFNIEEFGEVHNIDGVECTIIFDNEKLEKIKSSLNANFLSNDTKLFCVRKSELGFVPQIEENILIDGKMYQVDYVKNDNEVLEILISIYK